MSATTNLTQTPRHGLDPVNPKLAQQYEQIVHLLARRLSPAHAQLFAEPVPVTLAGTGRPGLAWIAALDGQALSVTQLDPADAARLRREADRLLADIRGFADTLANEGTASRDLASLIRDALIVPDADHLWSVDGQPVLVAWGYRHTSADTTAFADRAATITASAAAIPSPTRPSDPPPASAPSMPVAPAVVAAARRKPALRAVGPALWVLAALMSALLADRLLQACAVGNADWPGWLRPLLPDHCLVAGALVSPAEAATLAAIRTTEGDLHEAELTLTRRALTCEPPPAPAPAPVTPRAAAPTPRALPADVERRLEGIERGRGLELTLAWEGASDLDVQVLCPDGKRIQYNNAAACGGRLVADRNRGGGTSVTRPIEHIIWDEAPTPEGRYGVEVSLFERHGETRPDIPFRVVLSRQGQVVDDVSGRISKLKTPQGVLTFDVPADVPAPASAGAVVP